jgi:alpha-glucoside transport system substrate-binding protein
MRTHSRGRRAALAAAAALSLAASLAACGGDSGSGSNSSTVTIWSSVDQPVQDGLKKALEAKIKANDDGITIKWEKVENINQLIITKIQSGDTPDIALVPQPCVVTQMNQLGAVKPLDDAVDMSALQSSMMPGTLDAGTIDSKLYGLLVSANVKGLVFYNKKDWADKGYDASSVTDFASLEALADSMKAKGDTPWCFGIESDTATGWPATDWLETLVMKQSGVDAYNSWVSHDTAFDDDVVQQAGEEMQKLLFDDGDVLGGVKSATSTNFGEAGTPRGRSSPDSSRTASRETSTPTWASSASRRPPPVARTPSRVVATCSPCSTTAPT